VTVCLGEHGLREIIVQCWDARCVDAEQVVAADAL